MLGRLWRPLFGCVVSTVVAVLVGVVGGLFCYEERRIVSMLMTEACARRLSAVLFVQLFLSSKKPWCLSVGWDYRRARYPGALDTVRRESSVRRGSELRCREAQTYQLQRSSRIQMHFPASHTSSHHLNFFIKSPHLPVIHDSKQLIIYTATPTPPTG